LPTPGGHTGRRSRTTTAPARAWLNRIVGHDLVDPRTLLPNPRNWRRHPAAQQRAVAGALDEVGLVAGVTINRRTGHLVDGHLRRDLAIAHGETRIPATFIDVSEAEERLILTSLDPLGALAEADTAMLADLLAGLAPDDAGLRAALDELARRNGLLAAGRTEPDAAPALPSGDELYVRRGDLWELAGHRLLVDDATDAAAVDRLFGGDEAALLVTDPPYFVGYSGTNHPQTWADPTKPAPVTWDADPGSSAGVAFYERFLAAALPHLRRDAALYQWHAEQRRPLVEAAWAAAGLHVHQTIIWAKRRATLGHSHYLWAHEPCLYGWRAGTPPARRPPANARTVWQLDEGSEADLPHPTQKPAALFARPIGYHTSLGEICFDPFLGSGSTLIAASQIDRRCFGLELDPAYAQVALERWQAFSGLRAVRRG
jgi:DNA modification methylase